MRPRALHLSGFTTFRSMDEPVSFLDADLFALTGPTGSGKTSLLDAMCFALYGRVPRLDARAVEPVISLGAQEARIGFEFSVGSRMFTAARVVKRTKTGATTPEARLEEHIGEVIEVRASGADQVNETVARLLGLSFDQFTKAVLLPQGAFAAFLHDTPAKRQELLRTLLDLGVYERMRERAQFRKARADTEVEACGRDLARLAHATAESEIEAERTLLAMAVAVESVVAAQPRVDDLANALSQADMALATVRTTMEALAQVKAPADMVAITQGIAEAVRRAETAAAVAVRASEAVEAAEKDLATMPALTDLVASRHEWLRRGAVAERVERGKSVTAAAADRKQSAVGSKTDAGAALSAAAAVLAVIESQHQGHALASRLKPGDECPVCLRPIESLVERVAPEGLEDARRQHGIALEAARAAADEVAAASAYLSTCGVTLTSAVEELAGIDADLLGRPTMDEVTILQARVEAAEAVLAGLRTEERSARQAVDAAQAEVAAARRREVVGRRELSAARDRVAAAGPPEPELVDLATDWVVLTSWAEEKGQHLRSELAERSGARAEVASDLEETLRGLDDRLAEVGLASGTGTRFERVIRAQAEAEQQLARIREDRRTAAATEARAVKARAESELARVIARHLQANGFEGWLMEEALETLVSGANSLLADLSVGSYSLRMDKRDFSVVDHRNADETRGVKTLSGGETFLVSLALALSLADQIGSMAGEGGARLESMFLDEGFGTLDADTLEVVAGVIQELGATGRTVGLVTHVKELAELVPVRFEVARDPGGSKVTRVET